MREIVRDLREENKTKEEMIENQELTIEYLKERVKELSSKIK